jgi:hypothetical protein
MTSPEILPDDIAALRALVLTAWAERDAERAETARLIEERAQLAGQNDRLRHLIRQLQRMQFGRRSEKLDPDQFNLALEDLELAVAESEAEQEKADPALRKTRSEKRRAERGPLPEHLPRVEIIVEPEDTACPCCGSAMHVIGEDRSQRLDVIPAQYQVIVTRRPKYACRSCQGGGGAVAGAGAADRGRPADRAAGCPYRRREICRPLPALSPGSDPGAAGHHDRSGDIGVLDRLRRRRGQTGVATDTRRVAALGKAIRRRDDGAGSRPRSGAHQEGLFLGARPRRPAPALLKGFSAVLQTDGYAAYRRLADPKRAGGPVTLAFCWAHWRRQWFDLAKSPPAPIATEALTRIAKLYEIEAEIHGKSAEERRAVRQETTKPLIAALKTWLEKILAQVAGGSSIAQAIRYGLNHWDGLVRFLDDGRIEIDSNTVERSMRPIALNRKNALFAGSDEGAENWAMLASLIET